MGKMKTKSLTMRSEKRRKMIKQTILKLLIAMIPSSERRTAFLKKHNVFDHIGKDVIWASRTIPTDPKLVRIHNNVKVAADVTFINHDMLYDMYNHMEGRDMSFGYTQNLGCIEVMDNVLIGRGSIILPNIKIGPNAVVAAGSVVVKDVKAGTVVGGNPAKVIGSFDQTMKKQKEKTKRNPKGHRFQDERILEEWEMFEKEKT